MRQRGADYKRNSESIDGLSRIPLNLCPVRSTRMAYPMSTGSMHHNHSPIPTTISHIVHRFLRERIFTKDIDRSCIVLYSHYRHRLTSLPEESAIPDSQRLASCPQSLPLGGCHDRHYDIADDVIFGHSVAFIEPTNTCICCPVSCSIFFRLMGKTYHFSRSLFDGLVAESHHAGFKRSGCIGQRSISDVWTSKWFLLIQMAHFKRDT